MAMVDRLGLSLAVCAASAALRTVTLIAPTLDSHLVDDLPEQLIGDCAYDADPLEAALTALGIELIAPHRRNQTQPDTTGDPRRPSATSLRR